jgi:hypothetical protein
MLMGCKASTVASDAALDSPPDATGDTGADVAAADGQLRCARTEDRAAVRVRLHRDPVISCASVGARDADGGFPSPIEAVFSGMITGGDTGSLVIDDCATTDPGCVPDGIRIEVDAPGIDLTLVPRVRARVRARFSQFWTCQQWLEVTAIDPADGSSQQVPAGLLLLAVDDGAGPLADSPYTVDRVRLGCHSEMGCGSPAPDEYAFEFHLSRDGSSSVRVYMGETVSSESGLHSFRTHNLRSYQTTNCDDYWNFAYTIALQPP